MNSLPKRLNIIIPFIGFVAVILCVCVTKVSPWEPPPDDITQSENLWYFDGYDPTNYPIEVFLTATGATEGTFKWEVTAGASKVNLENDQDTITLTDDNTVGVKSTDASGPSNNDVTIKLTYNNGEYVGNHTLTVYAPTYSWVVLGPSDSDYDNGFLTEYVMDVRDQFECIVGFRSLEVNESFAGVTPDTSPCNWPAPEEDVWMTEGPSQFTDGYTAHGSGMVPEPVNIGKPGYDTRVMHMSQFYWAGTHATGQGRHIKSHVLQYYRGQARQE